MIKSHGKDQRRAPNPRKPKTGKVHTPLALKAKLMKLIKQMIVMKSTKKYGAANIVTKSLRKNINVNITKNIVIKK